MTSAPVRDPLADHLLTPENAAFLLIDYQPAQLAAVRSMDHALLMKNAVSTRSGAPAARCQRHLGGRFRSPASRRDGHLTARSDRCCHPWRVPAGQ